jgi:hypothetical protein
MDGVCTRFARNYAAARRKFLRAAEIAGLEVRCGCGAHALIECVYEPEETR